MGRERDAEYYDRGFRTNWRYKLSPDDAPWAPLWRWVVERTHREMLVEFGCGPGHLAALLSRSGHPPDRYLGIDFSKVALRQARKRVPAYRFVCDTLPNATTRMSKFQGATAIFCEVLEHFKADGSALKNLPDGTRVLATVPLKDSAAHVRHFKSMLHVRHRYGDYLAIKSIARIDSAYAFEGTRRRKKSK